MTWQAVFCLGILVLVFYGLTRNRSADALMLGALDSARPARHEKAIVSLIPLLVLVGLLIAGLVKTVVAAMLVAGQIAADPRPFVMAVVFAASTSFVTPLGYQTNLMAYGPGGYRFTDFVRIGLPLNLILLICTTILIPMIWSF